MPRGKDTSRDPKRRVDNVVFGNFGHPMQNHPAFLASRGMLSQADKSKEVRTQLASSVPENAIDIMALKDLPSDHPVFQNQPKFPKAAYEVSEQDEVEMAKKRDDAPVHGIPRPMEYTKVSETEENQKEKPLTPPSNYANARKVPSKPTNTKEVRIKKPTWDDAPAKSDDAPVHGIPRPKLTKKEMED